MFEGIIFSLPLTLTGLGVGFLVGLTGVGGGALLTPVLIFGFHVAPIVAVGTDLLFAAITKSVGAVTHARQATVHWRIVKLLLLGSIPSAIISVIILSSLQSSIGDLDGLIRNIIGVTLVITAVGLLLKKPVCVSESAAISSEISQRRSIATVIAGAVLGFLVTFSSIGAGAIGVVVLCWLYPQLSIGKVIGTDIVHAVGLTFVASIGHMQLGSVDYSLLMALLLGSLPGIYIGSRLSVFVPEKIMKRVMAGLLVIIGINIFVY